MTDTNPNGFRDKGDGTGLRHALDKGGVAGAEHIHGVDAIGTENAHAIDFSYTHLGIFQRSAGNANFAENTSNNDDYLNAQIRTSLQSIKRPFRREDDDRQINWIGDITHIGETFQTEQLLCIGVDGIDGALLVVAGQVFYNAVGQFIGFGGSTNDQHSTGIEDGRKVTCD